MKGDITLKILEMLEGSGNFMEDLFTIFTSPYGSSMRAIDKRLDRRERERRGSPSEHNENHRFRSLIYQLKKDGLIRISLQKDQKYFSITEKGKNILDRLRKRKKELLPLSTYIPHNDDTLKIVIFDIPEKERRKRRWLTVVLQNLNFKRVQKSVWIGKTVLPEQLLHDLQRLHLLSYVEIFAISKKGSLKRLTI